MTLRSCILLLALLLGSITGFAQKGKTKEKTGVTAKYDMAGPFCNGLARVKTKNKWGYIDTTGNVVVPPKYNEVENFSDGIARVRIGQKWGLIDTTGKEINIPKKDIESRRQSETSIMPANFGDVIPERDFDNLLAYLLSKGVPVKH